jgi:hypothetical protein
MFNFVANLFRRKTRRPAAECAAGILAAKNRYDALRPDPLRRHVDFRVAPTETEQTMPAVERLRAYRLGDEAYDNYITGSVIDTSVRLTVGATGGRPFFTGANAEKLQAKWDAWASTCGHQEAESWSEILGIALRASKVHGDCLAVIDADITGGKVKLFDADQVCDITDFSTWASARGWDEYRQVAGAVVNPAGQVAGYFVTGHRQTPAVTSADAEFLPVEICRRIGERRKISQYRGESQLLPLDRLIADTNALISAEVASARNHAELSFAVIDPPGAGSEIKAALDGAIDEETGRIRDDVLELLPGGLDTDPRDALRQLAPQPAEMLRLENKSAYGRFPAGTQIQSLDNANRPSPNVQSWQDKVAELGGQRFGLQSCLSHGRTDASYSAGQLELAISWRKIAEDQAMLERQLISYAVSVICPGAEHYTVQWPSMLEMDPEKTQKTMDSAIKGGRQSYQEQVGPGWRKKLDALKEVTDYCRAIGLDPATLSWLGETTAGNEKTTATVKPAENA